MINVPLPVPVTFAKKKVTNRVSVDSRKRLTGEKRKPGSPTRNQFMSEQWTMKTWIPDGIQGFQGGSLLGTLTPLTPMLFWVGWKNLPRGKESWLMGGTLLINLKIQFLRTKKFFKKGWEGRVGGPDRKTELIQLGGGVPRNWKTFHTHRNSILLDRYPQPLWGIPG